MPDANFTLAYNLILKAITDLTLNDLRGCGSVALEGVNDEQRLLLGSRNCTLLDFTEAAEE